MASASSSIPAADMTTAASPLAFLHLPKEDEAALRQAIYMVVAVGFCGLIMGLLYNASLVLEPFLVPLLWAVLTGFVLHSHKASMARWTKGQLQVWVATPVPVVLQLAVAAALTVNSAADAIGDYVFSRWKLIVSLVVVVPILFLSHGPALEAAKSWGEWIGSSPVPAPPTLQLVDHLAYFVLPLCLVLVFSTCYLHLMDTKRALQVISATFWSLAIWHFLNWLWPPVLYCMLLFACVALILSARDGVKKLMVDRLGRGCYRLLQRFSYKPAEDNKSSKANQEKSLDEIDVTDMGDDHGRGVMSSTPAPSAKTHLDLETPSVGLILHPGVSALKGHPVRSLHPQMSRLRSQQQNISTASDASRVRRRQFRTTFRCSNESLDRPQVSESNTYIRGVTYACFVIQFYLHPALLHLLPAPLLFYMVKRCIVYFGLAAPMRDRCRQAKLWLSQKKSIIFPLPIQWCAHVFTRVERIVLSHLPNYVDYVVTILLIVGLILMALLLLVFVSFELYAETAYVVNTSGKILSRVANSSVLEQVYGSSLWDESYQQGLEGFLESAYWSGRGYITNFIRQMGGGNESSANTEDLEVKVLQLWDRTYQYWLSTRQSEMGPHISKLALATSFDDVFSKAVEKGVFDTEAIIRYCKENMGTLTSILEQAWLLVKGNVGLMTTALFEFSKLVFSGGSGVLNFALNLVVYFTALFYLLVNSDAQYKPVEMLSKCGSIVPQGFGDALNRAVNNVFILTFKMVWFYGCWTYLTHTVFGVSIVVLPVMAATFLAAVPVAGQYLVSVPAALELWLAEDRPVSALLLMFIHMAPVMVLDASVYSEVKRGIHPWLTSASIVGGAYYFGPPGVIYGPLLLCALFVFLTTYTSLMQDLNQEYVEGGNYRTPLFKRSESVY